MMQSDSIGALVGALADAQADFESVVKSSVNPHFKSKFAPLEVVIDATAPSLRKHGLAVVQTFGGDAQAPTLRTTLAHASGEWIAGEQPLLPAQPGPQGLAAASTYARRYGWQAIIGVAAEDDDGETASAPPTARQTRQAPVQRATPPLPPASHQAFATNGGPDSAKPREVATREAPESAPVAKHNGAPAAEMHWSERVKACTTLDALQAVAAELLPWAAHNATTDPFHAKGALSVLWAAARDAAEVAIGDCQTADQVVAVSEHPLLMVMATSDRATARVVTALCDKARRSLAA